MIDKIESINNIDYVVTRRIRRDGCDFKTDNDTLNILNKYKSHNISTLKKMNENEIEGISDTYNILSSKSKTINKFNSLPKSKENMIKYNLELNSKSMKKKESLKSFATTFSDSLDSQTQ